MSGTFHSRGALPHSLMEMQVIRSLIFIAAGVFLLVLAPLHAEAQAAPRMGYVNSQMLIREAPGSREAEQTFQQEMEQPRQELDRLELEIRRLIDQFQQQRERLAPEAQQARVAEIQGRQQQAEERAMELEEQAAVRRDELFEPIFTRIGEAIELVREEGNYAFIFDLASGAVISADPGLDLTDAVLNRLRQMGSDEDR
jgi:outer membrane protein